MIKKAQTMFLALSISAILIEDVLAQDVQKIEPEVRLSFVEQFVSDKWPDQTDYDYNQNLNYAIEELEKLSQTGFSPAYVSLAKAYLYQKNIDKFIAFYNQKIKGTSKEHQVLEFTDMQAGKFFESSLTKEYGLALTQFLAANGYEKRNGWLLDKMILAENNVEIRKLAEKGDKRALKIIADDEINKTDDVKKIKVFADKGIEAAAERLDKIYAQAKRDNDVYRLSKLAEINFKDAIEQTIDVAIKDMQPQYLFSAVPLLLGKMQISKQKINENPKIQEIYKLAVIYLERVDEEPVLRRQSWECLELLARNGYPPALYTCLQFMIFEEKRKEMDLGGLIVVFEDQLRVFLHDFIKINPADGHVLASFYFKNKNQYYEAYSELEKASEYGNFLGLKIQLTFIEAGLGQASSKKDELLLRYMAQSLDDGLSKEWTAGNFKKIQSLENIFTLEFSESLKENANLKISQIKKNTKEISAEKHKPQNRQTGTGFFISKTGHILTAAHVVEGSSSIKVVYNTQKYQAELIAKDVHNDVAILKINNKQENPFLTFANKKVSQGDKVSTFGYPLTSIDGVDDVKFVSGDVGSLRGIDNDFRHIRLNLLVSPGQSGGPLLDSKNNVIGIIVAKRDPLKSLKLTGDLTVGISYAVKNDYIFPLIEECGLGRKVGFGQQPETVAEAILLITAE
jgi:S1-C subfamily serine protease